MYTDLDLNLYAGEFGYYLTAYGRDEHDQLDTSNYISIKISESDYKSFTDDEDAWYGCNAPEYKTLLQTFILYQLNKKANKNV
jgi:hypothetical protein